jgi:serine-type D-Ala-D-Ala carboxypeptidase/endopeptidase
MTTIVPPTESQLDSLVEPYLARQQLGLGFAIGYASPYFKPYGNLHFRGNVQNQFGARLGLDGNTLFEIASISKTFTATLYALLIRSVSRRKRSVTTLLRMVLSTSVPSLPAFRSTV